MNYDHFIADLLATRGRKILSTEKVYTETHHIIPRCMGGTDEEANLIELYASEHFLAHKLLAEENPDNLKLQFAFGAMGQANQGKRKDITPEQYEEARLAYSKASSIKNSGAGNPMYGVHRYGVENPNFGKKHPGIMTGEKNGMYGKHYTKSEEEKMQLSRRIKESWDNYTIEQRQWRSTLASGENNGMYGKYGLGRSIKVKCIETGQTFVSILDAERKMGKSGLKNALRRNRPWLGLHWERLT